MKVGSLVYATDQGLGILAKSFYDHGIVTDPMVVVHAHRPTHFDWYHPAAIPHGIPIRELKREPYAGALRDWVRTMDVMLFFETPFDWSLIEYCREKKVKTAIMPMHECMPATLPSNNPDLWLCPSNLDLRWAFNVCDGVYPNEKKCKLIPVPVEVPWRLREKAEVFVHNAGHGGLRGRNGTKELLEAIPLIKSPIKLILRSQDTTLIAGTADDGHIKIGNVDVMCSKGTIDFKWLYDAGDVFVFPEKFNGLSLPLQEARAAGMLVMATDRFPMNTWLPSAVKYAADAADNPLIPVRSYETARIGAAYSEFQEAVIDPKEIALAIDDWYGRDISGYSRSGLEWAATMSWGVLGPKYRKALEEL